MFSPDAHVHRVHAAHLDATIDELLVLYEDSSAKTNDRGHTDISRGATLLATVQVVPDSEPESTSLESIGEVPEDLPAAVGRLNGVRPGCCEMLPDGERAAWTMPSGIVHVLNGE